MSSRLNHCRHWQEVDRKAGRKEGALFSLQISSEMSVVQSHLAQNYRIVLVG